MPTLHAPDNPKGKPRRTFRSRVKLKSKAKKFVRLRSLTCFQGVTDRITASWQISKIADYIQKECGEYGDVTRESLMKQLTAYRDQVGKKTILQTRVPEKMGEMIQEAEEALDEVKELADLFRLQKERIEIDVKVERNIKKLMKNTGNEVFIAAKILQALAAIKQDYGLVDRSPHEVNVNARVMTMDLTTKYGSEVVGQVMSDPEKRRKVISLVERMARLEQVKSKRALESGAQPDDPVVIDVESSSG